MIRHTLKLSWAYILEHKKTFILGLLVGFLFVVIFVKFLNPYLESRPQTITIGRSGNFTLQTLPLDIQEKISLGLSKTLPDGSATISAAISWSATDSGKTYLFKLNPNLTWHDGKHFSTSDVNYQLQDVKITPKNDHEVEFRLANSFSPLPTVVAQPIFRPGLIGLGEYRLASIKLSGRFLDSLQIAKTGQSETYKFYPTDKQAITALRLGKVQKLEGITDTQDTQDLILTPSVNFQRQAAIFFNTSDDLLSAKNLRQALVYTLPQNTWPGAQSFGPISPNSWAYNPNLKKYPQDLANAKDILSKTPASQSAKISLTAIPQLKATAQIIKDAWEKIGLKVEIDAQESIPENYQALLMFFEVPKDPDQYILWHSTSTQNITKYKSPKSDKLLEEGRQELEPQVRQSKYFEFQKAITEDVPAAFLYFPTTYTITRK